MATGEVVMKSLQIDAFDSLLEGKTLTSDEWGLITPIMDVLGLKRISTRFRPRGPYTTSRVEDEVIAELLTKGSTSESNWAALQPLMDAVGITRIHNNSNKENNMSNAEQKAEHATKDQSKKDDVVVNAAQEAALRRLYNKAPLSEEEWKSIEPVTNALGLRRNKNTFLGVVLGVTGISDMWDVFTVSGFGNKAAAGTSAAAKMTIVGYFSWKAGNWAWNWATT